MAETEDNPEELDETEEPESEPEKTPETETEETETEEREDPFPEQTPQNIRRKVSKYQSRLMEVGAETISISGYAPENSDDADENVGLKSVILQCEYNTASFVVSFPIDSDFVIFRTEYDVLDDAIYTCTNPKLGGDFSELEPRERWQKGKEVRESLAPEQLAGLLEYNRNVPIPQLEAWLSLLRSGSEHFTIETHRMGTEYSHSACKRKLYSNPTELSSQELYNTVTQLLSLRQGLQDILGGSYIYNGVEVPENFESLHPNVEEEKSITQREPFTSRGVY